MAYSTSKATCHFSGPVKWLLISALLILVACSKDEQLPFSDKPEIELIGVSHDTIREYEDVLIITISYQDGNGDLGFENPDEYALYVRDLRLANFDGFYIGPLSPPGSNVPITGKLNIEFPSLFLFGNRTAETTRFEVKMVDRSGLESNVLLTDPVVIIKP